MAAAPSFADAHLNAAAVLADLGRLDDAAARLRHALALEPRNLGARLSLGGILKRLGRLEEARTHIESAAKDNPEDVAAWNDLGLALKEMREYGAAEGVFERALALAAPGQKAVVGVNLATAKLMRGKLGEGFRAFEARLGLPLFATQADRFFKAPRWRGEDLSGKTILLYGEQGMGDALQFLRWAPLLSAKGAKILLGIFPPLARLASRVEGVFVAASDGRDFPAYDFHCSLMSLPAVLGLESVSDVPAPIPYVTPFPEEAEAWSERLDDALGPRDGSLRVGLVWSGSPGLEEDLQRSVALARLDPVLRVPGVRFVSLQKNEAAAQLLDLPEGLRLHDPMPAVEDFAATAAIVAGLDLVVSVDTSVAHLAGAMGKPVWLLSRWNGCWRWMDGLDASPWYPTMRVFRPEAPGAWDAVAEDVAAALREAVSAGPEALSRAAEADCAAARAKLAAPAKPPARRTKGMKGKKSENAA